MIERELLTILRSNDDPANELNCLVDEFRNGRTADDIIAMLDSTESEVVRIGAWITTEIAYEKYNEPKILDRLRALTRDPTPAIRLYAVHALFPSLDRTDETTRMMISRLRRDENEGVRMTADAVAARLGLGAE